MSVNSKMTAIADQIRTLNGGTEKLGLDAMATQVGAANSTVTAQASLISQIASALEGKAAGGSVELQYATGSKTFSGSQRVFSVSGLGFTPVFAFYRQSNSTTSYGMGCAYAAICASSGTSREVTFSASEGAFTFDAGSNYIIGTKTYTWHAVGY